MNCIIVDDEPLAQQVIEDYAITIPYLTVIAKCSSAFEAFDVLRTKKVDLIFLDIQMPNVTGIDFLNSLEYKPMIIFTTAFSEYALDAFNLNALDYLVKPIPFDRFLKAVNKAFDYYNLKNRGQETVKDGNTSAPEKFILVKSDYQTQKVDLNEITFIEGLKDYIKIHLSNSKPVITLNSLRNMAEKLPADQFIRVHKSYIVALNKVDSISRNRIIIGETYIPIGDNFKDEFYALLKNRNISI
jgi:two-component system, LytTR family, response regulator